MFDVRFRQQTERNQIDGFFANITFGSLSWSDWGGLAGILQGMEDCIMQAARIEQGYRGYWHLAEEGNH